MRRKYKNPDESVTQKPVSPALQQALQQIVASLTNEPVEDGYEHPGERLLEEALREHGRPLLNYLASRISDNGLASPLAAGVLRLLGRLEQLPSDWFVGIVQWALQSADIEIRDAAAQAIELREDPAAIAILKCHQEPCSWLADYMHRVLVDLER